jgi:hypothetical protein
MNTIKGLALIGTFIGVLTIFAEATPMKIGVVAFTTTLMLAGASHAADKIAFICSDGKGKDDYSLSIDLDRKLASFHMSDLPDADGIRLSELPRIIFGFKIKLRPAFIRKGSWIELPDRSTFFIAISTTQKTMI